MKTLIKIVFIILVFFHFSIDITHAIGDNLNNINYSENIGNTNDYLDNVNTSSGFDVSNIGQKGIFNTLIKIAYDIKTIFFIIAGLYFLILVIKLLSSEKTDESVANFKKGIIWISIGIIVMQVSYYFIDILYNKDINTGLADEFILKIIKPLIDFLANSASFFFIVMMIYSFYRIVSANGDDEKVKTGKMTVVYALIGFIVIKISTTLVSSIYTGTNLDPNISGFSEMVVAIINWVNGFVGLIVIIMIIYSGFSVLFSIGDEEKLKTAKANILYITIGVFILITNYLILTFFIK